MKRAALFEEIKIAVLGKRYDLSVAFLVPAEMKAVMQKTLYKQNKKQIRSKKETEHTPEHISNVLSFPLSKNSGEILLCPKVAATECKKYFMDKQTYLAYLFIHGLFHLKGYAHGATMESEERRTMRRFGLRSMNE